MNPGKFWTIILVLAIATAAAESMLSSLAGGLVSSNETGMSLPTCDATEGHCFNTDTEFMMDLESNHRLLLAPGRERYITYRALAANRIPCGKQGNSYYDCSGHKRANPYTRGCTAITRCYRYTH